MPGRACFIHIYMYICTIIFVDMVIESLHELIEMSIHDNSLAASHAP